MQRFFKGYLLWFFYTGFLILAILFGGRESFFVTNSSFAAGKYVVLVIFFGFVAYSVFSTKRENFFKTVAGINRTFWGRQIGIDLYISVFLSLALIYLVEGSVTVLLLWLIPVIIFANLAILPYIILNYGLLVERLIS